MGRAKASKFNTRLNSHLLVYQIGMFNKDGVKILLSFFRFIGGILERLLFCANLSHKELDNLIIATWGRGEIEVAPNPDNGGFR